MRASDISTMAIEVVKTNEVHDIVGRDIIIFCSEQAAKEWAEERAQDQFRLVHEHIVNCGTGVRSIFCS